MLLPSNSSSPPLSSLPTGIDLSSNYDGMYYGYAVSTVLFGITVVQAWIYININRDKWPLRCFVTLVVALDFVKTCLDTQIIHHYFVASFGNLANLLTISTPFTVELLVTVLIAFSVEVFFAYRVHVLRRFHWIIPTSILLGAIGGLAAGIASVVDQFQNNSLDIFEQRKEKIDFGFNLVLSVSSDIIATTALCWAFARSKTGIKRTDTILQKLFLYTVTRGLLVSINQLILTIIILAKPENFLWIPFYLSLSKVYVITMIAMLNSRDSLKNNFGGVVITDSDMFDPSRSTIGGPQGVDNGTNASKNHINMADTVYVANSADLETQYRAGREEVVNFPKPRGRVGQDSNIEMEDYERKGVLVTREIATAEV